ncbi:MAG: MerR family transcriptional regulator [Acidimicrobiales bacterium]
METLTIGQLAHKAGVHIETVRYYERRRLLAPPPRTAAGYRQYAADDLWRLQFIGRAKSLGFTLAEIGELIGTGDRGADGAAAENAADVVRLARSKLDDLDGRLQALADTRARLARLVDVCGDPSNEDCTALRISG